MPSGAVGPADAQSCIILVVKVNLGTRLLVVALLLAGHAAQAADPDKVLRLAMFDIGSFDPQQFQDNPSFEVFTAIYEGLYEYDYLASTPRLSPVTAAGPPVVTDDGRTWTIRVVGLGLLATVPAP